MKKRRLSFFSLPDCCTATAILRVKETVDCSEIWVFKDRNNCKHFELSRFIIIELILMLHYFGCVWKPQWSQLFTFFASFQFSFSLLPSWLFAKNLSRLFLCSQLKRNTTRKGTKTKEWNTEEKSKEMMYEF